MVKLTTGLASAMFVVMQLLGGAFAYGLVRLLYPNAKIIAAELTAQPDHRPQN